MAMKEKDTEAYLARIRKTVADSESLVSQVELRIAETDRMLERQGLTREQVLAMRFTDAQIEAANAELRRRGMSLMDKWEAGEPPPGGAPAEPAGGAAAPRSSAASAELDNRQRKFGMMMKPFQI